MLPPRMRQNLESPCDIFSRTHTSAMTASNPASQGAGERTVALRSQSCQSPTPLGPQTSKGGFGTRDSHLCFRLTVSGRALPFSRRMPRLLRLDLQATLRRFRHLFRTFGLPQLIRTDNGQPFASRAIAGLSQLSVWWISVGILPEPIEPGKPQQNGRTLAPDPHVRTANPPQVNLRAQQRRFNAFRKVYNSDRPHEGLDMETPAAIYEPSPRTFTPNADPIDFEIRHVSRGRHPPMEVPESVRQQPPEEPHRRT